MKDFIMRVSDAGDCIHASTILDVTRYSAIQRGSGIAERSLNDIQHKLSTGHAIIAFTRQGELAGFCFIATYDDNKIVSHSGMIVHPHYRRSGLAFRIKQAVIELSEKLYPSANMISITTTHTVMKMNHQFGFRPVVFEMLTRDHSFWEGCRGCVNYPLLEDKQFKNCICTAMKKEVHHG